MSGSSSYQTSQGTGRSGTRTVTAMFQSRTDAERAVDSLIDEGFSRGDVRLVPGSERDGDTGAAAERRPSEGFWESLADFFFPDSDRDVYAEGLSRGGFLVSVSTTAADHDRAIDILDDDGTIDLDEQETAWRSQGWSGRTRGMAPAQDQETRTPGLAANLHSPGIPTGGPGSDDGLGSRAGASGSGMIDSSRGEQAGGTDRRDPVIPATEDGPVLGKRESEGGRGRVRSYVVETPVELPMGLRREPVDGRPRQVDQPPAAGEDAFRERAVERSGRSAHPGVPTQGRIREDAAPDWGVDTEQRTVSDTVRRTDVEMDDQRGSHAERRVSDDLTRKS